MQESLLPTGETNSQTKSGLGIEAFDLNYPDSEVVFGFTYAVGTDYRPVLSFLEDQIRLGRYRPQLIQLSASFPDTCQALGLNIAFSGETELSRIDSHIRAGNAIRSATQRNDICALLASSKIYSTRQQTIPNEPEANRRAAYLIISLKRPEEIETLRRIYGVGFYLISIFADESERFRFLTKRKGLSDSEATDLIARDQKEEGDSGQRTRDTFQMADVFVSVKDKQYESGLLRFLSLVFGDPFTTPSRDEHAMFLAYAASLRSGDLARQVGAALTSSQGEIVALGCNDVPAPGGGLYWSDDGKLDRRDYVKGLDSNDEVKDQIAKDVFENIRPYLDPRSAADVESVVLDVIKQKSKIGQIAEFGRAVHAEMDALMAAGRTGTSLSRLGTLYDHVSMPHLYPTHRHSRSEESCVHRALPKEPSA